MTEIFADREFIQEPISLESEVRQAIDQLSNKKAPDVDEIHTEVSDSAGKEVDKDANRNSVF